jgi:hypothetical protein
MSKIIAMFTEFYPFREDAILIRPKLEAQIVSKSHSSMPVSEYGETRWLC